MTNFFLLLEGFNKLSTLKKWYDRHFKNVGVKHSKILYLPAFTYEDDLQRFDPVKIADVVRFVSNCPCGTLGKKLVRAANAPATPLSISATIRGLDFYFGGDLAYYTSTHDLDNWELDIDFFMDLHRYVVKYGMDRYFYYVASKCDNGRYLPDDAFNPEENTIEDYYYWAEYDTKKQRPAADDIRIRNDLGFFVDSKGKQYI